MNGKDPSEVQTTKARNIKTGVLSFIAFVGAIILIALISMHLANKFYKSSWYGLILFILSKISIKNTNKVLNLVGNQNDSFIMSRFILIRLNSLYVNYLVSPR